MDKKAKNIDELSNIELVLFGLRNIWRLWDLGGISYGRSPITLTLEPAIRLLSFFENSYIHFEEFELLSRKEIVQKIKERGSCSYQYSLPIFLEETSFLSRFDLACFLLLSTLDYINQDAIFRGDGNGFFVEREIIDCSLKLLGFPYFANEFDRGDLIIAAEDIFSFENRIDFLLSSETDL